MKFSYNGDLISMYSKKLLGHRLSITIYTIKSVLRLEEQGLTLNDDLIKLKKKKNIYIYIYIYIYINLTLFDIREPSPWSSIQKACTHLTLTEEPYIVEDQRTICPFTH